MACGLIGLGIFHGVTSALDTASKTIPARLTVLAFCSAEQSQNYESAYAQLFSSQLQQQLSESDYEQTSQALDQEHGVITSCARADNSSDTVTGDTVTIALTVSRGSIFYTGDIVVVKQGNDWRINQIDTSLDLG
jgi:hypothetical protein